MIEGIYVFLVITSAVVGTSHLQQTAQWNLVWEFTMNLLVGNTTLFNIQFDDIQHPHHPQ